MAPRAYGPSYCVESVEHMDGPGATNRQADTHLPGPPIDVVDSSSLHDRDYLAGGVYLQHPMFSSCGYMFTILPRFLATL